MNNINKYLLNMYAGGIIFHFARMIFEYFSQFFFPKF